MPAGAEHVVQGARSAAYSVFTIVASIDAEHATAPVRKQRGRSCKSRAGYFASSATSLSCASLAIRPAICAVAIEVRRLATVLRRANEVLFNHACHALAIDMEFMHVQFAAALTLSERGDRADAAMIGVR